MKFLSQLVSSFLNPLSQWLRISERAQGTTFEAIHRCPQRSNPRGFGLCARCVQFPFWGFIHYLSASPWGFRVHEVFLSFQKTITRVTLSVSVTQWPKIHSPNRAPQWVSTFTRNQLPLDSWFRYIIGVLGPTAPFLTGSPTTNKTAVRHARIPNFPSYTFALIVKRTAGCDHHIRSEQLPKKVVPSLFPKEAHFDKKWTKD